MPADPMDQMRSRALAPTRRLVLAALASAALLPVLPSLAVAEEENFFTIGAITVGLPWARAARAGASTLAFFKLDNAGPPDTLVSASTDAAERVEIVGLANRDGVITTIPVGPVDIPGGRLLFDPGGLGLDLVGLRRDLAAGESFQLALVFANAGALTVTVGVEPPGAMVSSEDH